MAKVVLVTGASSGIGEAIALRLLARGFHVVAAARRIDRMRDLAASGAEIVSLDLCDDASIVRTVAEIVARTGRIDAIVNNAGYAEYGALENVGIDAARRQFEVNLFGLARLVQLCLPHMRRQGAGRIVNISSIGGRIHEPMGSWYHATKFALEGLSDCLRMELSPFGIDVVVVQPGAIRTEWNGIARQSLLASSGTGPYADQARVTAGFLASAEEGGGSDPDVVARVVEKALTDRRPKTRYAVGGGARPLLLLRWLLSDRMFDGLMRLAARQVGRRGSEAAPGRGIELQSG